jgi:UDP-N-acetylmuramoyl-L-alanyl-D-glutamate--2,6-diaminopimelate ligase
MQQLQNILNNISTQLTIGNLNVTVTDVATDSRKVTKGSCFIAVKGVSTDGHQFIDTAIQNGASSIVCEMLPEFLTDTVTYIKTGNSAMAAGIIAHQFAGSPSEKLKLVGVTGTNGKTTVATLLFQLFTGLGYTCGLVSTVKYKIGNRELHSSHTTPDAIQLNNLLAEMADSGCTHVFMECSSHAIHQHRIAGLQFAGAVFTNITHDHLDYHQTFEEYIRVKKLFFDQLPNSAFAISNKDDKNGTVMLQNTKATIYYYGLKSFTSFKGKILENGLTGLHLLINDQEVNFRMIGEFNAYNLLAVFGTAMCLGEEKSEILRVMSALTGAEGRFDYLVSAKDNILAITDYAHTPDAIENVLATIKNLRKGMEQIITVVGCGGDRDKTKRHPMALTACLHSDKVIFTSDNPRSEDPLAILNDMVDGLPAAYSRKYITNPDRKEAIKTAVQLAGKDDIILVAGKGHETYQEIKGVKYPFDDKKLLEELLSTR